MLVSFTSFSPPSTGSGKQAEQPASPSRLWMAKRAPCWRSSLAPLPTFALEPRRHINKQLEVLTSSLVSNTAGVNVDLDTRHEMLLDVKPGESDGRKPSHCFQCLNHLRHHLHPLMLLLGDWSPSSGRRPAAGPAAR